MARRYKAVLNCFGTSQIHYRNPVVIAWWSSALPGFGHMLLNMHIKGNILFLCEIFLNVQSNLNLATVYTFTGEFDLAKHVLNTRLLIIYIPFYIFCIWDSYRSTVDLNKNFFLAEKEPFELPVFDMSAIEVCFLDKRVPWAAGVWSLLFPGLGQLYNRRIITAFALLIWMLIITYNSHYLDSIHLLFYGKPGEAKEILNMEWLLFFPSLVFGAAFDAYSKTVEHNKLFDSEQRAYLEKEWRSESTHISFIKKGEQP